MLLPLLPGSLKRVTSLPVTSLVQRLALILPTPGEAFSTTWKSFERELDVEWAMANKFTYGMINGSPPPPHPKSSPPPPNNLLTFPMVSSLVDPVIKWWRADVIRETFLPFEADTILRILLSQSLPEDKLIWMGTSRGEFTVKSTYQIAHCLVEGIDDVGISTGDPLKPLWKRLWHLNLLAKIKIFAWRACVNRLPSREKLCVRGINTAKDCLICNKELESIHHVLLHYEFAIRVWSFGGNGVQLIQRNNWSFPDSTMYILAHKPSHVLEYFFTIAWAIWYNRNRTIHEGKCFSPSQVWQMARSSIEDFSDATHTTLSTSRPPISCCWLPPPPGVFKINVDGASSNLEGISSIGVIIRDCKGETVVALCKPLQSH